MEIIKNFIVEHWKELTEIVLILATFLVALLKKTKVENPAIIALIDELLPGVIKLCEDQIGEGNGEQKKKVCIETMLKTLSETFADIKVKKYRKYIGERIELILSTPQKKGIEK